MRFFNRQGRDFHTIVIGAGAAGLTAALGLARLEKSVLLIEKDKIGGDCTHTGCIPSKALLHASRAVEQGTIDATEALQYARQKREEIYAEETPEKIEAEGVQVMQGLARFLDEHRLAVTATDGAEELEVSADHIIIATGSHPRKLNRDVLPSIDAKKMHTNESIFELETLPEKLVIVGGGPIGCEMTQAFSALGSEVTLLQRGERLLKDEAEHVSERVLLELESRDVEVRLETEAQDAISEIETADAVLQAIGRVPTLESLELNAADVAHTEHGIAVNDVYQTNQDHIYAIGDCLPRPKFTHLANQQARIAVRDIAFPYLPAQSRGPLPWVTYLKPEIATVGMTFQELEVIPAEAWDTIAISLDETDRSVTENESGEFVTVWHRRFTGEILRATIVAQEAGEMISTYTLAIQEGISLWKFSELIVPYPTKSQALRSIGDQFTFGTLRNLLPEFKAYLWSSIRQLFHLHGRAASAAIFWLSAIAGFSRYLQVTGQDATQFGAVLRMIFEQPYIGAALYILFYTFRPLVLFPAGILSIAAGLIYGLPVGSLLALIGGTLSAIIPYFMGRFFRSEESLSEERLRSKGGWNRRLRFIDERPFQTTLAGRLLFLPYDLVSVVAGTLGAGFMPFFVATFLGNIPGAILFAAFGSSVQNIEQGLAAVELDWRMVAFSGGMLLLSLGIQQVVERFTTVQKQ